MTDSMNFGPDWIRNLSSEGTTTGSNSSSGPRYQLADYRYGREEMLALFDKNIKPPQSLPNFKGLYSEVALLPLALTPNTEEEQRGWQARPISLSGPTRGRGGPLDRGGRVTRGGRGGYQNYGRPATTYDGGWGNGGEQTEWSPRKDFNMRSNNENWRRNRMNEEDDGWRTFNSRPTHDKWGRSTSWRGGEGDLEDRGGSENRMNHRMGWNETNRNSTIKKSWDNEDHLPEWVMENVDGGGGTFDSSGAFHNSDDEQGETKRNLKKETVLQKSSSHQHIQSKGYFTSLQQSKSVMSITKNEQDDDANLGETIIENNKETSDNWDEKLETTNKKPQKIIEEQHQTVKEIIQVSPKEKPTINEKVEMPPETVVNKKESRVEDDFKIQEDIILKMVDDDMAKNIRKKTEPNVTASSIQPPPNLGPPMPDQWFYQDPQGRMQGPFTSAEMAEWYKAGYFNGQLKVRRPCDELFYLLGELVTICDGSNPFLSNNRFPVLKPDPTTLTEQDLLQYQYLMALKQAQTRSSMPEPWSTLTLQQQQEAAAQRLIMHPQVNPDLQFMHQSATSNPLMHMINQMQQANKLPNMADKTQNSIPNQLDPRLVQLSNLHQLQNRLPPTSAMPNPLGRLPGLTTDGLNLPNILGHPLGLNAGMAPNLGNTLNLQRPLSHNTVVDNLVPKPTEDPISNLLKQLQQQKQQSVGVSLESMWQTNQFQTPTATLPTQQWQQQQQQQQQQQSQQLKQEAPISMWDLSKAEVPSSEQLVTNHIQTIPTSTEIEQEQQQQKPQDKKEDVSSKELKKRKEQEEKHAKKEAEEKRKNEQRKLEAEKKASEERKKKEEERIKKELEKAKKEAEEKRMRELEEKRRLKEQRKAEEEAKKKSDEQKKIEEDRAKKDAQEREDYAKREAARLAQEQAIRNSKVAPWCQSSSTQGMSLQEIQKLEKEKARQEAVILQQQRQMQEFQLQQQEKQSAGFTWAHKAKDQKQVKSLAEIQAEEQERLAKQAAEARLLALQKEKDQPPIQNVGNIWNSQNLSWSNNSTQWSSGNSTGLWEETTGKQTNNKPSTNSKGNTAIIGKSQQQQQHPPPQQQQQAPLKNKTKIKKEDNTTTISKNANNAIDEFSNWCTKTLSSITSEIDIPTFVTFLRDIESALEVREYCKEYLGDSPQTLQFASNFLEKRRSFKPKNQIQKDDMCSPAPAITPSSIHNNEFQEVKGKNKKNKKGKMLKVDNRILGFNVTSAPDRINVGDRDYGDNS